MDAALQKVFDNVLAGDMGAVKETVQAAVDSGVESEAILKQGLIPAMGEVGRLFEEGEYFVPEMLIAARAMQAGLEIIKPMLVESGVEPLGKVAIGTVQGDLHDIGKNLVAMMMEGAGFEIYDLGVDVPADNFIQAVKDNQVHILALSALLTTTMPNMQAVITQLQEAGLREQVKVLIGGAPVTTEYATEIGADGYAADASQAASLAKSLMN
ncbi:MAG: corrinoid protein [Anaerolineales bacterium]|nr:corrinoid protein [Anaerolineales bacterium]